VVAGAVDAVDAADAGAVDAAEAVRARIAERRDRRCALSTALRLTIFARCSLSSSLEKGAPVGAEAEETAGVRTGAGAAGAGACTTATTGGGAGACTTATTGGGAGATGAGGSYSLSEAMVRGCASSSPGIGYGLLMFFGCTWSLDASAESGKSQNSVSLGYDNR
jgi:hypothetical protein